MKTNSAVTFIEVLISLALISILMSVILQPRAAALYSAYGMGGYGGYGGYPGYYGSPLRRELEIMTTPMSVRSNVASVWSGYAYAPPPNYYQPPPSYYPPMSYGMRPGYMSDPYGMYGSSPYMMDPYSAMSPYGMHPYYGMQPMAMPFVGMSVAQAPVANQGVNVTNWIITTTTNWVMVTNTNK